MQMPTAEKEVCHSGTNTAPTKSSQEQIRDDTSSGRSVGGSRIASLHVHHGGLPEVRRLGVLTSEEWSALAVILGMVLYKDESQESAPAKKSLEVREEAETV
jgi:hypothetical protein